MSSPREEIIDRAYSIVKELEFHAEKVVQAQDALAELRDLCPWAFRDDGRPVPRAEPRRGGRMA